jgi:hypothetical protein
MSMLKCSACGAEKSQGYIRQCNKCHRILCDSCKGPQATCKDAKQGKSSCDGIFLRAQWR